MTDLLDLTVASVFAAAVLLAIGTQIEESNRLTALTSFFGITTFVLTVAHSASTDDYDSLLLASAVGVAFASLIAFTKFLVPNAVPRFDIGLAAFVGFGIGGSGVTPSFLVFLISISVSGLVGALRLVRHGADSNDVPFALILGAFAIGAKFLL